jgi:hypothetical protein
MLIRGFVIWQSKIIVDLVKQTEKNYDMQDELHQILQNLEESIIIMQNDLSAEFINDRFLYNLSKNLMDKIPLAEPVKKETPSKL